MVTERVIASRPASPIGGRLVPSPFEFQSTGEDNLRIEAWNSLAGVTLAIQGRWQQEGRAIDAFSHALPLSSDRTRNRLDVELGIGYVLNLTVFAASGTPRIGQTFVRVSLIRGTAPAALVLAVLLQGYVTAVQGLGWPGSAIVDSISGGGVRRSITGSAPALAAEFAETVPTGARWELLSLVSTLQTSAAAGNRACYLLIKAGATTKGRYAPAGAQVASATGTWTWAANLPVLTGTFPVTFQQPFLQPALLLAGEGFASVTTSILAGDQWSAPDYTVREWLEVDA